MDDSVLLRQYAENHSDEAFSALVERHVNLVYSVALRQTGDPHDAEEIAQAVFIILAKKVASLRHDKALSSWLFQTTRLTANNFIRSDIRRHRREQEAFMESVLNESDDRTWQQIHPMLDFAVAALPEKDRRAILLRFYEGRNLSEVGAFLGATEDAAEKRVARALEKLRKFFSKRGVDSTTAVIARTISTNSVQVAPVGLAKTISAVAMAKGAAASASTLTLVKGALKLMAWTKAQMAIVAGVGVLLVAGTATVTVKEIAARNDENLWRTPRIRADVFDRVAPQVTILPTKYPNNGNGQGASGNRWLGIDRPISQIVGYAYDWPFGRIVFDSGDPAEAYDMIANLPQGSPEALQRVLKNKLGLVAHPETRTVDALVLKLSRPNARGLKRPSGGGYSDPWGHFTCYNQAISTDHPSDFSLAMELELIFREPVIDQTGLTQKFNINLTWEGDEEGLKQALLDQLGLDLVPTNMPVEMLVVNKTK